MKKLILLLFIISETVTAQTATVQYNADGSPIVNWGTEKKQDSTPKQQEIIYVKEIKTYIDLARVLEIEDVWYKPDLGTGFFQGPPEMFEGLDRYHFSILYQFKNARENYSFEAANMKEAKKIHQRIIAAWKRLKSEKNISIK